MNILVACEESQRVCSALRNVGNNAFSCDVIDCSGGHKEWHIKEDVLPLLNGNCRFRTQDGVEHSIVGKWDMIIAFPPCTRLCSSGQRWCHYGTEEYRNEKKLEREQAVGFFMSFVKADCEKIAIENPIGIMSTRYKKPSQVIEPYMFGDPHRKPTCLWLKGLPLLEPTNIVKVVDIKRYKRKNGGVTTFSDWMNPKDENGKYLTWKSPETKKIRSKTFIGIAKAMAEQWGKMV